MSSIINGLFILQTEVKAVLVCSKCGKSDKLHDEGDTVYCSHCTQRTIKASGKIYLTKCPECGKMTRGGAAYCELCNGWKGE